MSNQIAKKSNSRFSFFGDIIGELKKVSWLTRREALYLTGLVLLVAATVGAILGGLDYGFSFIVNNLIIGG
ncbi:MAG: preprotein translocase subunit SecE [Dehalococcoidales bacterium]|nr:preprotein translocase subunit SecE [Dehalococcoidales bacterium]